MRLTRREAITAAASAAALAVLPVTATPLPRRPRKLALSKPPDLVPGVFQNPDAVWETRLSEGPRIDALEKWYTRSLRRLPTKIKQARVDAWAERFCNPWLCRPGDPWYLQETLYFGIDPAARQHFDGPQIVGACRVENRLSIYGQYGFSKKPNRFDEFMEFDRTCVDILRYARVVIETDDGTYLGLPTGELDHRHPLEGWRGPIDVFGRLVPTYYCSAFFRTYDLVPYDHEACVRKAEREARIRAAEEKQLWRTLMTDGFEVKRIYG